MNGLEKIGIQQLRLKLFDALERINRMMEKQVPDSPHLNDVIRKAVEIIDSLEENNQK